MFNSQKRETVITVKGVELKLRFPTISDEILIESKKHTLTRSQYASMSLGLLQTQVETLNLTDAIATLSTVADFVDEKKYGDVSFSELYEEEDKAFILEAYTQYLEWRNSFRKKPDGDKEE